MKKIASDIKLVFHSSTITMMHGPINIRRTFLFSASCLVFSMRRVPRLTDELLLLGLPTSLFRRVMHSKKDRGRDS